MSEVGSKAISFKLYREGEDLESLEIPEAMTVRQLATIHANSAIQVFQFHPRLRLIVPAVVHLEFHRVIPLAGLLGR